MRTIAPEDNNSEMRHTKAEERKGVVSRCLWFEFWTSRKSWEGRASRFIEGKERWADEVRSRQGQGQGAQRSEIPTASSDREGRGDGCGCCEGARVRMESGEQWVGREGKGGKRAHRPAFLRSLRSASVCSACSIWRLC